MKTIEKIAEAGNFAAISVGKLNELGNYVLELAPGVQIPGKVFGGAALGATGGEFSFQVFQPGQETGFLHTHKTHEELYFFLKGEGEFQVDGQVFPVGEGTVVRVAPAGKRGYLGSMFIPVRYPQGTPKVPGKRKQPIRNLLLNEAFQIPQMKETENHTHA